MQSKRTKGKRKPPAQKDEWKLIIEGKLPWNYHDYCKVAKWYHELHDKPKDDWDLKERGILYKNKGKTGKIIVNSFMPENQLAFHMLNEYGEEGFKKYFWRFFEIGHFLVLNQDSLEKDKLIVKGKGSFLATSELLKALCALPFSKIIKRKGETKHTFDYKEVVEKAKEIQKEEDKSA